MCVCLCELWKVDKRNLRKDMQTNDWIGVDTDEELLEKEKKQEKASKKERQWQKKRKASIKKIVSLRIAW